MGGSHHIYGARDEEQKPCLSILPTSLPLLFILLVSNIYGWRNATERQRANTLSAASIRIPDNLTIFGFFGETRRSFVVDAPWHIRFNFCCRENTKDHHIFMTSWKLDDFQQNNSPEHGIKILSRFQSQKWKRNNRKTRDSRSILDN